MTEQEYLAWRREVTGRALSYRQIAAAFDLTPMRVMQIEKVAIQKIRRSKMLPLLRQLADETRESA